MEGLTELIEQERPRFRTATAFVADTLRRAILAAVIEAGATLRQDELAKAFGFSRMPVREALRQLEAEGLVDFVPHCGAIVSAIQPGEIAEIFEVRRLLEPYALRRSLPKLADEDLARASALLEMADREPASDLRRSLNRQFHLSLYAGMQGARVLKIIEAQYDSVDRHLRQPGLALEAPDRSRAEHREILENCTKRDVWAAVKVLKRHLSEGQRRLQQAANARS